mmetsp:Transcript_5846/g.4158  ORF Transcript_5846/g.4158 Transcript_5846/m.4158 type:complete len:80 (+) Transcript_5846:25-264(+)
MASGQDFSLAVIAADLKTQQKHDQVALTMDKCVSSCFMSLKENKLLPSEDRCLRNCFVKNIAFQNYFDDEMRYFLRNSA